MSKKASGATLGRYWRTIRYLRTEQLLWRIYYKVRRRLGGPPAIGGFTSRVAFEPPALDRLRAYAKTVAAHHKRESAEITLVRQGKWRILGEDVAYDAESFWRAANLSPLAAYTRQYMHPVADLALANAAAPTVEDGALVFGWMRDWIGHETNNNGVAWDAFPISCRVMNWSLAFAVFGPPPDDIARAYAAQIVHLRRNIEYDVQANHLHKNAVALVVAAALLGDTARTCGLTLDFARNLLMAQVREQILPDGGHYERSPMYHCHVLEDHLFALAALNDPPGRFRSTTVKMARFLAEIVHDDGGIPLFGDAALDAGLPPQALLGATKDMCDTAVEPSKDAFVALEPSGFYSIRGNDGSRMIVKAGPPGPAHQLGHAHCDQLSYEFTVDGRRVIVDSGVCEYGAGPMRGYLRGTHAHNTAQVGNLEQHECWGAFRVGRRARSVVDEWRCGAGEARLRAHHDGFAPHVIERIVQKTADGLWIVRDLVQGPSPTRVRSYLHVHPELDVVELRPGWQLTWGDEIVASIWPLADEACSIESRNATPPENWYCPRFGEAIPSDVLVVSASESCPVQLGYVIVAGAGERPEPGRIRSVLNV